jgi:hypothetical protein
VAPWHRREVKALGYEGSIAVSRELFVILNFISRHGGVHDYCLSFQGAKSVREFLDYFRAVSE